VGIFHHNEVNGWLDDLAIADDDSYRQIVYAIEALAEVGANLGRPRVGRINGSAIHNLKELRRGPQRLPKRGCCSSSTRGAARFC